MPNIFDGLYKMDLERLEYLIASLETVTMKNVASEMGQKTKKNAVKISNKMLNLFNKSTYKEPEVITLEKRIEKRKRELSGYSQSAIQTQLLSTIVIKLKDLNHQVSLQSTPDEISVLTINEASKAFKNEIDDAFTPAQKADEIKKRYDSRLLAQNEKNLKNQTEQEQRETELAIQAQLTKMSESEKEELRKALQINELSGNSVRKVLSTATGTGAALAVLQMSGFGAYMALTTIMHAIFTTTMGITLPFAAYTGATSLLALLTGPMGWIALLGTEYMIISKQSKKLTYELLAQVVWSSVSAYGRKFAVMRDDIPAWINNDEKLDYEAETQQIETLKKENDILKNQVENLEVFLKNTREKEAQERESKNKLLNEIKKIKDQQKTAYSEVEQLKLELEIIRIRLEENQAQTSYDLAQYKMKHENDIEREKEILQNLLTLQSDNINYEKLLKEVEGKISAKDKEIENLESQVKTKMNELNSFQEILEKERDKLNAKSEKTSKQLQKQWTRILPNIDISPQICKSVVKEYSFNDQTEILCVLMELNSNKDPASLNGNRGKMYVTGDDHIIVKTESVESRIYYKVNKENSNKKKVEITSIRKKNYSRLN